MADPFATTYAGAFKGISAWGEALGDVAESYVERKKKETENQQTLNMLKQFGLGGTETALTAESNLIADKTGTDRMADETEAPPKFINEPSFAIDPTTGTMKTTITPKANPEYDIWQEKRKKETELQAKIGESRFVSEYNLNLVQGTMTDYMDTLTDAYREGSAGWKGAGWKATATEKGLFPPAIAGRYKSGAAAIGKKEELVFKMFPMFTQQIGKEGSIRLIQSLMEKIGVTVPDIDTAPQVAPELMRNTVLSLYRVVREIEKTPTKDILDLRQKTGESEGDYVSRLDAFANRLAEGVGTIRLSPKEEELVNGIMGQVTSNLDKYLVEKGWKKEEIPTFESEEEAEASGHKGMAIIGGRKARIE